MDESRRNRILGMALVRGLLSEEALLAAIRPNEHPLDVLRQQGVLEDEDISLLNDLVCGDIGLQGAVPQDALSDVATDAGPSVPPEVRALWQPLDVRGDDEDASGTHVLKALSLPEWQNYRNLRFIGEGGMGRIFKAFDPRLKRIVALKFLRREDPDLVQRFRLEAQLQAMVDHPNVCRVYEVGVWKRQSYIAMQLIKGETLEGGAPQFDLMTKAEIMERVADAMHAAHRQGLVHRDLKPANIMVEHEPGARPRPYVLDFGLARGIESSGLTVDGALVGTTHYMAPEQARGAQDLVGRRTDVYAMGATLYRLLGGRAPFGDSAGLDVVRRVQDEDAPPLRRLAPEVPKDLETIVMKCLEREPDRRYGSAKEFAEDLRRFLDDEPILARPPSFSYRMGKRIRKHRAISVTALVGLLVMLGLGIWGAVGRYQAARQARLAQQFGQEAERLEAMLRYAHLLPLHDTTLERRQIHDRMDQISAAAVREGPIAAGPAAYALGRAQLALGEPDEARKSLQQVWDSGFRTPDVSYALGRALGQVYQARVEEAQRISSPDLRKVRLQQLDKELRDPAQKYLREGSGTALEPMAFQEALLAFYQRDFPAAIAKARQSAAAAPWFYEARRLEGEILLAQARESTPEEASRLLEDAVAVFKTTERLAPSDPFLSLGLARARLQRLSQAAEGDAHGEPWTQEGLAACERAAKADLSLAAPHIQATLLKSDWGALQGRLGKDLEAIFASADQSAREALRLAPKDPEAHLAQARALSCRFLWLFTSRGRTDMTLLDGALAAGRRASALAPQDPAVTWALQDYLRSKMVFAARVGDDPGLWFKEVLPLAEQSVAAFPDVPDTHLLLSSLLVEWAEIQRGRGEDPTATVNQSLVSLRRAQSLMPGQRGAGSQRGYAYLVLGEYQLDAGLDPRETLRQAMEAFRTDARLCFREMRGGCAMALIDLALYEEQQGRTPLPRLEEVRAMLRQQIHVLPHDGYTLSLVGLADLVEVRWQQTHGHLEGLETLSRRGEDALRRALAMMPAQESQLHLAELLELRAARTRDPKALAQALAGVEDILWRSPRFGLAHVRRASILARQAAWAGKNRAAPLKQARTSWEEALACNPLLRRQGPILQALLDQAQASKRP